MSGRDPAFLEEYGSSQRSRGVVRFFRNAFLVDPQILRGAWINMKPGLLAWRTSQAPPERRCNRSNAIKWSRGRQYDYSCVQALRAEEGQDIAEYAVMLAVILVLVSPFSARRPPYSALNSVDALLA